jgi:predicted acyl esterase
MFAMVGRLCWALAATMAALALAPTARAATETLNTRVTMSDGVSLAATVTGRSPLTARPVIVEFSPYGPGTMTTSDGPAYNYLLVQDRGTGASNGEFDALGPRSQQDVAETLRWACHQPWSDRRLGLNGFSASAIIVYNSLHLKLPCVRTAVLRSGTFELYRDLLWPGGVENFIPGLGVLALIGAPAAAQGFGRSPVSDFDTAIGLIDAGISGGLEHPTLDSWWQQRGFRGDANHLPILMLDSFFDVESRGAFQGFQALRRHGAHLLVVGAHDGAPAGTDDGDGQIKAWFDHYLLGARNGIRRRPRVQLLMSDGSRERYAAGHFVHYHARNWPVPGTHWESLWLSAARASSGASLNDGSLVTSRPLASAIQSYVAIPSVPTMSDVANSGFVGPDGLNEAAATFPLLTETTPAEALALTYTSPPLSQDLLSAGPAALDVRLSSTAPETAIWAVIADVWPDGSSHPVAAGRLLSAYPGVIASKSLSDSEGDIVQPYGDYSHKSDAPPLVSKTYQVEFWPMGNRFKAGDRIRLVILGASAASLPGLPALNLVAVGGPDASRLLLPVLPRP